MSKALIPGEEHAICHAQLTPKPVEQLLLGVRLIQIQLPPRELLLNQRNLRVEFGLGKFTFWFGHISPGGMGIISCSISAFIMCTRFDAAPRQRNLFP